MKNPEIVQTNNEHNIFQPSINGGINVNGRDDVQTNQHLKGPLHEDHPSARKMIGTEHEQKHLPEVEETNLSPPTVTATESSCTTAFPSLPPCQNEGNHICNRPTRDRVLRMLSNALMRRSLTMVSFFFSVICPRRVRIKDSCRFRRR